jgi:hypothetical protein
MQWIVFCLIIITLMMLYFPTIFIRKMNKLLKTMEQIETNTRSRTP